jgi:hypothetical protein
MQTKRRKYSPTTQHSLTPQHNLTPQPHKRMFPTPQHSHTLEEKRMFPTSQFEDQSKRPMDITRTMNVYNTPGEMAIRRANVRDVLIRLGFIPTNVSHVQLKEAFDNYTLMYPKDYDITLEDFSHIVSAYHGGKIRHKKHIYSYKKRSMNKKRKSMKSRLL